ncbi:hypothetical protein AQPE_2009 [Aquipluma nitroreducens]|uniref:Exonuclease domain-containing protein n=1 Tax=Aquipluma nitroreducens TaxID=2010828 RepID=A0A5K7S8I6_9BACT|nr:WG repeat-containing protein [Aquipluma nitroreducens]BBE17850.1 hypothetical protein AQPE_2009 [Aquipluma nitroreducens]
MGKIILVVDIETTGYLKQGGKIVEIGIVKLDLETGGIIPVYSSLIKEPGLDISHMAGQFGWIFRNSNLTFDEVMIAPTLEEQRSVIQHILNLYEATAYNKAFDFGFLKDRGFQINELPCPMQLATPIMNIGGTMKWPSVEEAWGYFFGKTGYIETHRSLDDAIHEAKIVHKLYKMGQFEVSYYCLNSQLLNYYREADGSIVFVYTIIGTTDEFAIYRAAQGAKYKENKDGVPLFFSKRPLSTNRNEIIQLIITENGSIKVDDFTKVLSQKKKLDEYILREKSKLYDNVISFSFGLAVVKSNKKYGFIDHSGEIIIPLIYDSANSFHEGLALVSAKDWKGFIDRNGNKIIDVGESNYTESFSEGLAVVSDYWGNFFGYIDSLGNTRISLKYNFAESFSCGLAKVDVAGTTSFINHYGAEIIQIQYDEVESFSEGLALVSKNNKYGFIDQVGNEVIAIKYDKVYAFSEGLAAVNLNNKWGFIDNSGFIKIPLTFDYAESFSKGFAYVSLEGKEGKIDKLGNEYWND